MPNRHFLSSQEPLSQQVAASLPDTVGEDTLIITPTAGAGRRIGQQAGLSRDQLRWVMQPMHALLQNRDDTAGATERCLAWATAIRNTPKPALQPLFWKQSPERTSELLKAGRNFIRLCDRLAEAGLSPQTLQLPEHDQAKLDTARWSAITALYQNYLDCLDAWKLPDPNAVRLLNIAEPNEAIRRVIIACVPDLPRAFEHYAEALAARGAEVDVLVWNPRRIEPDHFDAWGRPVTERWKARRIEIAERQIHVAGSAKDEARLAARQATDHQSGLVVADQKMAGLLASEIRALGGQPYLPDGTQLIGCEAAKVALEWSAFRQSQDLRSLRRLLELPAFCRALAPKDPLSQSDALIAIDHVLGKTIASQLDAAWAASPALPDTAPDRDRQMRAKVRRLLGLVRTQLGTSVIDLLEAAYPETGHARTKATEQVLAVARALQGSPALSDWPNSEKEDGLPAQVLSQAIRNEQVRSASTDDAVTLNGWLEAPWLPQRGIMLSGLVEGRLPQSLDGDSFLPDSICPALGLSHNEQRLARDTYLLDALLASRPAESVHLSFSKYNPEGDPNRPSRLLFSTTLTALPARVQFLTRPAPAPETRPRRNTNWRWQLPTELPAVKRISPTDFESYLSCPFRFCLGKVLRLDSGPMAAREMDASVFGNLIHYTLEDFGRAVIPGGEQMLRLDEQSIRRQLQDLLAEQAYQLFGPKPTPAVQVQIASAEARLYAFARVQAECFAEGWVILDVERKLETDGDHPLTIGPLRLSGVIDRIERHLETGQLRVMDYKTFSSLQQPGEKHFAAPSHNWFPPALVDVIQKGKSKAKTWKNLQLPLYRKILEHWYPEGCRNRPPTTAYFVLPSDPNDSGIYPFIEMDDPDNPEIYESALSCATAAAAQIADGVFWPPQPFRNHWDDPIAALLVNGAPESCIAPESIERLKGVSAS